MQNNYTHLSYEERVVIRVMRKEEKSLREISRALDRAPSTVSRELKRNEQFAGTRVIYPDYAQMKANGRRRRAYLKPHLKTRSLQRYVIGRIEQGWSPMVIAGRLKHLGRKVTVSHEAIYQFIYSKRKDLCDKLVRHHKRRKRFRQSKKFRNKTPIPGRISINERPASIATREQSGHWEGDLMIAGHEQDALQILAERKSRVVFLSKMPDKKAATTSKKIIARLRRLPPSQRKSITYDNGKENVDHQIVNRTLGTKSYFADPYASWQKGTVENIIGIVRRTYPKGTSISKISLQELKLLERRLNSTPRKSLQFRTPMEVFRAKGVALQC